jgi:hypothetical protein
MFDQRAPSSRPTAGSVPRLPRPLVRPGLKRLVAQVQLELADARRVAAAIKKERQR